VRTLLIIRELTVPSQGILQVSDLESTNVDTSRAAAIRNRDVEITRAVVLRSGDPTSSYNSRLLLDGASKDSRKHNADLHSNFLIYENKKVNRKL
jgi:hypothetical protein